MRAKRGEKRAERWEGIEKGERKWEDKRPREREVRKMKEVESVSVGNKRNLERDSLPYSNSHTRSHQ